MSEPQCRESIFLERIAEAEQAEHHTSLKPFVHPVYYSPTKCFAIIFRFVEGI